ncbi:hypothetical protein K1T73_08765 [Roseovarius sp. SCSIO 43702]|uniref:hypothetical protein n=1 Tax=Roseovarius sp. SCSIO 43702 TaxID=2823043 RepID=UPI001C72AA78|nr:hypothetical protein [Roseovarius sp. SCSIO 43702]QYX58424.1 hypothetical protein K1T73_08765 [Roseovarius sp. SCSIO 43702]
MRERDPLDPKGLIRESYRIEGIGPGECRSIFLDWALSMDTGRDTQADIAALLERYAGEHGDHPMTQVLREGQKGADRPRRRGGWKSRPRE